MNIKVPMTVVRGATAERVTTARANDRSTGLLDAFLAAACELVQDGADGITTSCGFLSIYQRELAAHCGVPVAASALAGYMAPPSELGLRWSPEEFGV